MPTPKISRYRLHRCHLVDFNVGIPTYESAGREAYFTGTNAEANAERRRLTDAEPEPGYSWMIMDAEPAN